MPGLVYQHQDTAMGLPESEGGGYRFGFNNQEKETRLGDYYSFEYRMHDARLGRFLSVDPLASEYTWNSTYAFAENRVIQCIDLEGCEARPATTSPAPGIDPNAGTWSRENHFIGPSPISTGVQSLLYVKSYYNVITSSLTAAGAVGNYYKLDATKMGVTHVASSNVPNSILNGTQVAANFNTWTPVRAIELPVWTRNDLILQYASETSGVSPWGAPIVVNQNTSFSIFGAQGLGGVAGNQFLINSFNATNNVFNSPWSSPSVVGGPAALAAAINFGAQTNISDTKINPVPGNGGASIYESFNISGVVQQSNRTDITGIVINYDASAGTTVPANIQALVRNLNNQYGTGVARAIPTPGIIAAIGAGGAMVTDPTAPGGTRAPNAALDFTVTIQFSISTRQRQVAPAQGGTITSAN